MSAQNDSPAPRVKWHWVDRLLARLEHLIQPFMNVVRVLWLTGWSTLLFAVGLIFFLVNDQGLDILRRLVETRGWRGIFGNLFFLLGVIAWGPGTAHACCSRAASRSPTGRSSSAPSGCAFGSRAWEAAWLRSSSPPASCA
jgi:hypothetical protein